MNTKAKTSNKFDMARELLNDLYKQFPDCLSATNPRALKIGIFHDIKSQVDAPVSILRTALMIYTKRFDYLRSFEIQKYRIKLDGTLCLDQPITQNEINYANMQLRSKKRSAKKKNINNKIRYEEQAEEQANAKLIYNNLSTVYPKAFDKNNPLPLHFHTVIKQLADEQKLDKDQISIALKWWIVRWEYKKSIEQNDALYDIHGMKVADNHNQKQCADN